MRDKIWSTLVNMKYKSFILALLVDKFQKWDRNTNIFLAVCSSGSIAAWAIWKKFELLWGIVIAVSQVLTVLKPYFPYYKYVKELNGKSLRLDNLNIELERLWDKLEAKKLTEDEAGEVYYGLLKEKNEIFNFGDDIIFDVTKEMERKASESTASFLASNYKVQVTIDYQKF